MQGWTLRPNEVGVNERQPSGESAYPGLSSVLTVLERIGTCLADDAVIPMALAHQCASLPTGIGSEVLRTHAQRGLAIAPTADGRSPGRASMKLDRQQVEVVGRSWLINELMYAGFEVALPMRDRGVDLLVSPDDYAWTLAVQLKTSRESVMQVHRKYLGRPLAIVCSLARRPRHSPMIPATPTAARATTTRPGRCGSLRRRPGPSCRRRARTGPRPA